MLSLVTSRRFWPLMTTQALGVILDSTYKYVFIFMVLYLIPGNGSTRFYNILASALLILPFLLFSSLAGDLCDKHSKSKMLQLTKIFEVFIIIFGIYALYIESITAMLTTIFLLGTHSTFISPLKLSLMPEYLKESELVFGNSVLEITTFASILGSELLANAIFAGKLPISFMMLAMAVVSLLASFKLIYSSPKSPDHKVNLNLFASSLEIVAQTRKHRTVYLCILGISWFWLVSSMIITEVPVLLKDLINTTPGVITMALMIFAIGISVGSALCTKLLKNKIEATYVPLAAFGISFLLYDLASLLYTFTPNPTPLDIYTFIFNWGHIHLMANFFLIGMLGGLYHVPLYTIMQHEAPVKERARIMACHNIVSTGFTMVGAGLNLTLGYVYNNNSAYSLAFVSLMFAWLSLYISQLIPYDILTTILRWFFKVIYRADIKGIENFKAVENEKIVIIANHVSWLDALILTAFLPEKLTFALNTNMMEHWLIRYFIKLNKVIMIDPTQPMAIRGLLDAINDGENVVIFPEGRVTETGSLMKLSEAPVMVAQKSHAKILPIHIKGMEHTFFSRTKLRKTFHLWTRLSIEIYPAVSPPTYDKENSTDNRTKRKIAADFLYTLMTGMNYESNRMHKGLFDSLIYASKIHGSHRKIFNDINRKPMSYHQLLMRSFILRLALKKPLAKESHIGLFMPTAIPTIVSFFSLQSLGKTPVMLNYTHGPSQVVNCCETAEVKTIITAQKFIDLANLSDHIHALEKAGYRIIYLDQLATTISLQQKLIGALGAWMPETYYRLIAPKISPQDAAIYLFTSGSEGSPKAVALSHDNLHANIAQITSIIDFNTQDTIFNTLPLFHSFGMLGALVAPVIIGVKVFLYPSPLHYRIIAEMIYDTNATILFSTDYFLSLYAQNANAYDFYSLRYVFAGAEKLQDTTIEQWSNKFGIRILQAYGVTEASPGICVSTPMHNARGSVGRILPAIEYKLEPTSHSKVGGRLWIRGPNIMMGYILHSAPGIIQPPKDGWHDTGDIFEVDSNGYFTIIDRAKRFVKVAGEMISLTAVEQVASEISPEHNHATVGIPSEKRGEEIVLCTDDPNLSKAFLQVSFKEKGISELWAPKQVIHMKEIPKFATGKTNYPELTKLVKKKK